METNKKDMVPGSKHELEAKEEKTQQARFYKPSTDIIETEQNLTLYMDMPGVAKNAVEVKLEKNVLTVDGRIDQDRYKNLKAQYAEYNVGHYSRSFQLSSEINQDKILAKMEKGVLTLTLPKAEQAKPKLISIQ
ncbi:MAG: Hsp20/alpha crystallin family protein [Deltaproteobacteria bacterium]|nr:Hsp20/alpha crystallin family protein [Deltaproteobacteria bacterium]